MASGPHHRPNFHPQLVSLIHHKRRVFKPGHIDRDFHIQNHFDLTFVEILGEHGGLHIDLRQLVPGSKRFGKSFVCRWNILLNRIVLAALRHRNGNQCIHPKQFTGELADAVDRLGDFIGFKPRCSHDAQAAGIGHCRRQFGTGRSPHTRQQNRISNV